MFRFKELCENYQTGYYRRPLPHRHVSKQNNSEQVRQVKMFPYMEYTCFVCGWVGIQTMCNLMCGLLQI